ncbi:hypothetical protein Pcinc_009481 [Petrolisthes cinctipes]|uniref:CLIP domain-containing serine protease n=1 Tax=Petrolisthes cinctipes TaxID=88211 RepID=A0AAE1G4N9_PETCI|nr:hypothetical protein Pcinc_009481 [Petrolisthes cinctipes]
MFIWWTVIVVVLGIVDGSIQKRQASICGQGKSCTPLFSCVDFRNILAQPNAHTSVAVRRALCNRNRRNPMVCCSGSIPLTPPTSPTEPPITFPTPSPGNRCQPRESCKALRSCRTFEDFFNNPNPTPEMWSRIRRATCNNDRRNIHVCCIESTDPVDPTPTPTPSPTPTPTPTPTPSPTPPIVTGESLLPAKCRVRTKRQNLANRFEVEDFNTDIHAIIIGTPVKLTEFFPWMALLGYNSQTSPFWGCGGSLITEQYVLTAAHCVHSVYTSGAILTVVRLGELNLDTAVDCEDGVCAQPHQDFNPVDIVIHPDFDTRAQVSDDIALIKLDRKVKLNNYVDPLCLPPDGANVEMLLSGRQAEVSGWGLTESGQAATILQKANIPFVSRGTCNPLYDNILLPEQVLYKQKVNFFCQGLHLTTPSSPRQ